MKTMGTHQCPECENSLLVSDPATGELYCGDCGLISEEYFLDSGDTLSFSELDSHAHLGPGEMMGPSTEIAPGYRDGKGNRFDSHRLMEIHRLRKTERFTKFATSTGRNLNHMLGYMSAISSRLQITRPAKEFALHIYSDLVHRKITVGRDARALAAASIYAGCRYYSLPYLLEDVARTVLDDIHPVISKKRVGKAYRIIMREMQLKNSVPTPYDYIARYSSELDLTPKIEKKARELLRRAQETGIPGGEPASIAAALIYLAAKIEGQKVTQKDITDITGVTDTTIRTRYRELKSMFKDT